MIIQLKINVVVYPVKNGALLPWRNLPEGKHVNYMCRTDVCKEYDIHIFHANCEGRIIEHVEVCLKKERPAWL